MESKPAFDGSVDGIIERLILHIYNNPGRVFKRGELSDLDLAYVLNLSDNFNKAFNTIRSIGVIDVDQFQYCRLEKLGHEIILMGGWKKYQQLEEIKRDKTRREYKFLKITAIAFWPMSAIALISGSITINDKMNREPESKRQSIQYQTPKLPTISEQPVLYNKSTDTTQK